MYSLLCAKDWLNLILLWKLKFPRKYTIAGSGKELELTLTWDSVARAWSWTGRREKLWLSNEKVPHPNYIIFDWAYLYSFNFIEISLPFTYISINGWRGIRHENCSFDSDVCQLYELQQTLLIINVPDEKYDCCCKN